MAVVTFPANCWAIRSVYVLLLLLVAIATKGTMSVGINKMLVAELRDSMPGEVEMLQLPEISATYANFGHRIDYQNTHQGFGRFLGQVPKEAIRLRLLLGQGAGSEITSLDIIAEAVVMHVDFPWYLVSWYLTPMSRSACLHAVGGRVYAGFAGDLVALQRSLFRRVACIACELLISNGNKTLRNVRGTREDPTMK